MPSSHLILCCPLLLLPPIPPSIRVFWIPPKKDTLCPQAKAKPQQDGRRGAIAFEIKSQTRWRRLEGANKTLCAPRTEGKEQWPCLWVSPAEAQVGSDVRRGQGLWLQQTWDGRRGVWPKSSWRRSPLAHHRAAEQMIHRLQNNYIKEVLALLQKFWGPQQIT